MSGLIKEILNSIKRGVKSTLFKKVIRKEPVVIKDVENNLLKGKHAIITGGSSGIGYAIARKFIESGAIVTIIARNSDKTKKAAEELACDYLLVDLSDTEKMIPIVSDYINSKRIDIQIGRAHV